MGSLDSCAAEMLRLAYARRKLIESIGRRAGVSDADLADLVQRVVLILLAKYQRIEPGSESGFLAQVARREAHHLRRTYQRRAEDSSETFVAVCAAAQPDDHLEHKRLLARVTTLVNEAPPQVRDVWVSHVVNGESCQEVASATGLPLGTVKSRLRRIAESLSRQVLGEPVSGA